MSFRELLEGKMLGKLVKYEKLLYTAYIEFLKDHHNVSFDVDVSFRKPTNKMYFGYIDLISLSQGKNKIVVEKTSNGLLGKIGHEFTHVVQYNKGDLGFNSDHDIFWKGVKYISIKDLNLIKDLVQYKKLPWEKEAYKNQSILPNLFKESKYFLDLEGKDASLDFLLQNKEFFN